MYVDLEPVMHPNALKILEKRYLWTLPDGSLETPKQMFWRVSAKVASAEAVFGSPDLYTPMEQVFMEMMCDLRFVPNTPTLTNAGRQDGQLAACYVLPIGDSMSEIMDCLKAQAMVQKSGGGTGFNYGNIRERGAQIKSTGKTAVGPIPIIKLKNYMMSEFIIQGGTRNGANMGVLPIDHPDIEEFIGAKKIDGELKSFNLSPSVPDAFMEAVKNNGQWNLISRVNGEVKKTISAVDLFDTIARSAWSSGDPGMLFIDAANRQNPTPNVGRLEATNPCAEQYLLPNEACTLGHLNLGKYFIPGTDIESSWRNAFNWALFKQDIRNGVRFLDNVIEVNYYALPEIEEMHRRTNRKIGLGVMGLADLLILLKVPYNSKEARRISDAIGATFRYVADAASHNLAKERGSFGSFEGSAVQAQGWTGMRNACRTTVAPTGSTAIFAGCSTSIEPIFGLILQRDQAGMVMYEVHPLFQGYLNTIPKEQVQRIYDYYAEHNSIQGCPDVDLETQRLFMQANDIAVEDHIEMQATWQTHIDNSISKTINMPNSATVEDVKKAYMMAWELGCKGVTVYRDGCKANQALSMGTIKKAEAQVHPLELPQPDAFSGLNGSQINFSASQPGLYISNKSSSLFAPKAAYVDNLCPECNKNEVDDGGGCSTCKNCGWSVCHI